MWLKLVTLVETSLEIETTVVFSSFKLGNVSK